MTFRAILVGLILASLIAAVGYVNDEFTNVAPMVCFHFPLPLFGLLVLAMVTVQPLLVRAGRLWGGAWALPSVGCRSRQVANRL